MITVRDKNNELISYNADKVSIDEKGYLVLERYDEIGVYKCPLRTVEVARLAPGFWGGYSVDK